MTPTQLSDAEFYTKWAKERIEALCGPFSNPMWSRSAFTHRRTEHVAFTSTSDIIGDRRVVLGRAQSAGDMAERLLVGVRLYAERVAAPRVLVWRAEPALSVDRGLWSIYARLCFEPDPMA